MIDYNGTKIIAIDHGYGNIKTANTVTPTGITEYDSEPVLGGDVLEYDGKWYKVGDSHKAFIADKSSDDEFYLLTLVSIAKELDLGMITDADIHIACGLPLKWTGSQKDVFRDYLLRSSKVCFRYNDKEYHIKITGCTVLPQSYPAIAHHVGKYQGTHMVADIGNGTMNIMYIIDKKPVETKCWTEKIGVNECMIRAENAVMEETGAKIEPATIERVLRFGTADIPENYLSIIRKVAEKYASDIFETLGKYEYKQELVKLHILGGGAVIIRNFGKYDPDRVEIIEDICANAKGYEYVTMLSWRKNK